MPEKSTYLDIPSVLVPLCLAAGLFSGLYGVLISHDLLMTALLVTVVGLSFFFLRTAPHHVILFLAAAAILLGNRIAGEGLATHQATLPRTEDLDRAYQITARALYHWQTPYGSALKVDQVRVISPVDAPFRLDQLTLYLPGMESFPPRYDRITTWIRLKRGYKSKPFPNPLSDLMERFRPRYYGSVKDPSLISFTAAKPTAPNGLNQGNRELLAVFLAGRPSFLWRERLAPFGLGHLLAISGLHCLFVYLALQLVLCPLRRPIPRALLTIVGLTLFAHWVGWTASVTRASLMLMAWQLLPALNRHRSWLRLWATFALIILLADPTMLLSRGFWYSFSASLGLILGIVYRPHSPLVHPWLPRLRRFLPIVAAQCFVVPVNLVFGHLTLLTSLFWNLLGFTVLLILGSLLLLDLVALAVPVLAPLANAFESVIGQAIGFFAQGPGFAEIVRFPQQPGPVLLVLLGLALILGCGRREYRWYAALTLVCLFLLFHRPLKGDRLLLLDVGQGLSMLYVSAQGEGHLFDAGGELPGGVNFRHVLELYGVKELRSIFISHLDDDHVRFLEDLPAGVPTYLATDTIAKARKDPLFASLTLKGLEPGDRIQLPSFTVKTLWPPPGATIPSDNEASLVLLFEGRDWSLLFTGDAGLWGESRFTPPGSEGRRLLQVGHHGSRSATGSALLDTFDPELALISCGRRNRFGHPHPDVLGRLRDRGISILETPVSGTIEIAIDGLITLKTQDP